MRAMSGTPLLTDHDEIVVNPPARVIYTSYLANISDCCGADPGRRWDRFERCLGVF